MKFELVVVVALALFACTAEAAVSKALMNLVRPMLLDCANQNNLNSTQLANIIANDISDQSRGVQCTSLCFFEKLHMMDSSGNFNSLWSTISFSFGAPFLEVRNAVNTCGVKKGNDPTDACETAAAIYACYVQIGFLQPNDH